MSNFKIDFEYPLLLLLLIPAIALALWLYFRISKKYRRTRNRVASLVLRILVIILSASVLSGIAFAYEKPNYENEVILLVDVSYSNRTSKDKKNEFIQKVLNESNEIFQIGIVTFAKEQVYAADLSYDTDKVYKQYLDSRRPDDSATDIASALNYTKDLFNNKRTAKIVLITDGIETDGSALSAIMSVVSEGIRVDTVHFPNNEVNNEVQLIAVETPNYNILAGDTAKIGVTIQSSYSGTAVITLYDNDTESESKIILLKEGIETFYIDHKFMLPGPHEIYFKITSLQDTITQNNTLYSYLYLQVFDKLLIIDRDGESSRLRDLIKDNYNVDALNIKNAPNTLVSLAEYDQVILMNIANADMPEGFSDLLYKYVHDIGGGLLTIGGNKTDKDGNPVLDDNDNPVANTYNRQDMKGTLYQQMLPVEAIDYTPPLALMIVIDKSGSMLTKDNQTGKTRMDLAKEGAKECVNALSDRDYVGVISFSDKAKEEIAITKVTQKNKVLNAISNIETVWETVYTEAIQRAGEALHAFSGVERKHIIFVTDGEPNDPAKPTEDQPGYETFININTANGITMSVVAIIGDNEVALTTAPRMADLGNGNWYNVIDVTTLPQKIRDDVKVPELTAYNPEAFTPKLRDSSYEANGLIGTKIPDLGGYYGVKLKSNAESPLMGPYTPIYAKWNFGKGKVGSFMCDLEGIWSDAFLGDDAGMKFLDNVIKWLFPTESIRKRDISAIFTPNNYSTQVLVNTTLSPGDIVEMTVKPPSDQNDALLQIIELDSSGGFPRGTFAVYSPGVYEVKIEKRNSSGTVISEYTTHYAFSYSAEYNTFIDQEDSLILLANLAQKGKGRIVSATDDEVLIDYKKTLDYTYDPRIAFIILVIVLFLLDIAVRKFKFKWPWEIIHDYKIKRILKLHDKN